MRAVHHAIDVVASPEECWRAFADLSTWPEWFPFLAKVTADGDPWRLGARIKLTFAVGLMRVSVTTTVEELDPPRRVRWVGKSLGVSGDHYYSLDSHAPGTTRFTSHEEFSGFFSRIMPGPVLSRIDGEVHRSMERFKALVEARTRVASA